MSQSSGADESKLTALLIAQPPGQRKHLPALDGIRGLAILLVMLCHYTSKFRDAEFQNAVGMSQPVRTFYHFIAYGWTGVDLFFVLSGFLITGILFDAKGGAHFFKSFYMRRVLRIFPLYYGMLIILFVIVPLFSRQSVDPLKAASAQDQAYWWFFAANIAVAIRGVEFYGARGVFWSLAVEEHFYFIWPVLVRFLSRWWLIGVCILIIAASLVLRIWMTFAGHSFNTLYVLTPCRLDALASGALLSLLIRGKIPLHKFAFPAAILLALSLPATLIMIALSPLGESGREFLQTWGFSINNITFASLLLLVISLPATGLRGVLPKFFSSAPMVFFGKYSYAMYIFHFFFAGPLNSLFKEKHSGKLTHYLPGQLLLPLAGIVVTSIAALASWHLFEKHFLALKRLFPYDKKPPVA